ncbi:ABC transporter permease [Vagococcus fessus]|uniref:ABC3 transporter permease protein domain-containing protein n=1 Tax=Vagococcus fessus TaxID=120370 RepID=A0A430A7J9_9ENTE|nr:ABC transporter permease [Vagococcus fessus]RSU03103.1 hypothetical protein CBF31_05135 [Vagococcus fessus]
MNYFKRAIASVTRKKGKSLILFAVIFILGNVIAGAISIQQATQNVEKNIKKQLGGTATVGINSKEFEKFWNEHPDDEKGPGNKELTLDKIKEIGSLPYVKYYDYNITGGAQTKELKMYQKHEEEEMQSQDGLTEFFSYKGVNYPKVMDIEEKKVELTDGRVFTEEEIASGKPVAIISKQMAKKNNLKVGDKLVVDSSSPNYMDSEAMDDEKNKPELFTQKQVFDIIGLFSPIVNDKKEKKRNDVAENMVENLYNLIYAPNDVIKKNNKAFEEGMYKKFPSYKKEMEEILKGEQPSEPLTPYFVLKTPEDAEAFKQDATALLPDKYSKLIMSTDQYDSIAGPVKNMSKIAKYVIYVSVGATLLIISLVVLLFLRDRKHELGIYISLGEKRTKVIGQIVIEVVMIAFVAITLSVFTGNVLAKNVSGSLISTQMKAQEDKNNDMGMMNEDDWELAELTGNSVDATDVKESYEVSLSAKYIGVFYVVGLLTVLLSTVIPLIYILRLNPKKIMM